MIRKDKTFIVAEIGNNHEGNYHVAKKLIKSAKECGADAVKFQTFIPELYIDTNNTKRFQQLQKFQLSFDQFKLLSKYSKKIGIIFLSTPFDIKSAKFLNSIQKLYKISSSDSNFIPLIETIAKFNKTIMLSTGLSDIQTITKSKNKIFKIWNLKKNKKKSKNVHLVIMHCVTSYPVLEEEANLLAIKTLKSKFKDCIIGYSDHTVGIYAALAAVTLGAKVIEKHFTLSKSYSNFRDHKISSDPKEMKCLINNIRNLEKAFGNGKKEIQNSERKYINTLRRRAIACRDIKKNDRLFNSDIKWVRADSGYKIEHAKKILGKKLKLNIRKNEIFKKRHFF